jgi:hypothetical protein
LGRCAIFNPATAVFRLKAKAIWGSCAIFTPATAVCRFKQPHHAKPP